MSTAEKTREIVDSIAAVYDGHVRTADDNLESALDAFDEELYSEILGKIRFSDLPRDGVLALIRAIAEHASGELLDDLHAAATAQASWWREYEAAIEYEKHTGKPATWIHSGGIGFFEKWADQVN